MEMSSAQRPAPQLQQTQSWLSTSSVSLGQTQRPSSAAAVVVSHSPRSPSIVEVPRPPQPEARAASHRSMRPQAQPLRAISSVTRTPRQLNPSIHPSSSRMGFLGNTGIMRPRNTQNLISRRMAETRAKVSQLGSRLQSGMPRMAAGDIQAQILATVEQFMIDMVGDSVGSRGQEEQASSTTMAAPRADSRPDAEPGPSEPWSGPHSDLVPDNEEQRVAAESEAKGKEPVSILAQTYLFLILILTLSGAANQSLLHVMFLGTNAKS
jgi:hypothetical protein